MSYRTEEKQIQWKLRRIKAIVFAVVFFIVIAVGIFSAFVPPATWKYYFNNPSISKRREGELRMHFVDVGQGDCTIIELPDGKVAMIDGGNGEEGHTTSIMRYLNALKIKRIDYLILTHADTDHCGGLSKVLEYQDVGVVYFPLEEATINTSYAAFFKKLSEESCEKKFNRYATTIYSSDDRYEYQLTWLWPYGADNPAAPTFTGNDKSAVLYLSYGENQALFMGDVSATVETKIVTNAKVGLLPNGVDITSIELLKVSHHGSADGTCAEFLQYTQTKSALISCGNNNAYGHPATSMTTRLQNASVEILRTDEHGNVLMTWTGSGEQTVEKGC